MQNVVNSVDPEQMCDLWRLTYVYTVHLGLSFLIFKVIIGMNFIFVDLSMCKLRRISHKLYKTQDFILTLLLLNTTCPVLANNVDPDQLASEEAN